MDRDPGDRRRADLRASDADRERFVETLRRHHADGRLTADELAERTERTDAARTFGPPAPSGLPPRLRPPGPERAAAKAGMPRSILWYGILSVFLIVIWALSDSDIFWPVWPILGFMLLIAWQAINLWSRVGRYDDDPPRPWER